MSAWHDGGGFVRKKPKAPPAVRDPIPPPPQVQLIANLESGRVNPPANLGCRPAQALPGQQGHLGASVPPPAPDPADFQPQNERDPSAEELFRPVPPSPKAHRQRRRHPPPSPPLPRAPGGTSTSKGHFGDAVAFASQVGDGPQVHDQGHAAGAAERGRRAAIRPEGSPSELLGPPPPLPAAAAG